MTELFEISSEDIGQLNDTQLRELIGLLCEADYRLAGLPTNGITWGGHQDAPDGGFDVVVRSDVLPPQNSFVPRSSTGFQVKKPDMPRSKISEEMKPKGGLREEIKTLIKESGAYIIFSSSGSTTESALNNRKSAMRDAVSDEINHDNLAVDFYDRGRVATWVRMHPSMILWVRNRVGRQLSGWRPYENWSNCPAGVEEEYILDDGLRLYDGTISSKESMAVDDGLTRLRSGLSIPSEASPQTDKMYWCRTSVLKT